MIVCIPSTETKGLASAVSEHFGKAPFHYIINTANRAIRLEQKPKGEAGHCLPASTLIAHRVEMVLCKGIGRGAVMKFEDAGIQVMRTTADTIEAALEEIEQGRVIAVREEDYCSSHGDHEHGAPGQS